VIYRNEIYFAAIVQKTVFQEQRTKGLKFVTASSDEKWEFLSG